MLSDEQRANILALTWFAYLQDPYFSVKELIGLCMLFFRGQVPANAVREWMNSEYAPPIGKWETLMHATKNENQPAASLAS